MTTPTAPITATITRPDGSVIVGAVVTAKLSQVETYDGVVVPTEVSATTNAAGVCLLNLWPNGLSQLGSYYNVRIVHAGSTRPDTLRIHVPNTSAADLHMLRVSDDASVQPASSPVRSIAGQKGDVTLTAIGLDQVNNTADLVKPVSAPQWAALDGVTATALQAVSSQAAALAGTPGAGQVGFEANYTYPVRSTGAALAALILGQASGVLGFDTLASLQANLTPAAGTLALVTNDPTPANNLFWRKTGSSGSGSWVLQTDSLLAALMVDAAAAVAGVAQLAPVLAALSSAPSASITTLANATGLGALAMALTDESGQLAAGVETDGTFVATVIKALQRLNITSGLVDLSDQAAAQGKPANYDFAVCDESGNALIGYRSGVLQLHSSATTLQGRNALNLAASAAAQAQPNTLTQRDVARYNITALYGQSLAMGNEAWPALSKTARLGNLMLGGSVRPASNTAAAFTPVGAATLQPLVECVQDNSTGAVLSDAAVAALTPGDGSRGETVLSGALNFAKRLHNDTLVLADDTTRLFVGINAAVGGRTIEELSKGASPNLYLRYTQALTQIKALADAGSVTAAVSTIVWMQGEYNYQASFGGTTDRATYKALLTTLRTNMVADAMATTGQTRPPAFLLYQTGATWARDNVNLSIAMAQWEFSQETPGAYLVGPVYQYPDKGGHLCPNASRWYGAQLGKVRHRVVTLGQSWRPLSPTAISAAGLDVEISFHVPVAPLVFADVYVETTPTSYTDKGFRLTDDNGAVPVTAVQIVAPTIVRITLARPLAGNPYLWYASQATGGAGNLRDSDPALADDTYQYTAGTGQYAAANIPALVGNPYPLHNWAIAFRLPIPWSL